ncbi:ATP-dependent helicase HrpB [Leucobacter sp. USHLN153]|uniref:ATP-dependent helicase HrpB n=1 Tax=Leucobacter sp. USHLN153 TaxID=3081268 RepID=UPI003015A5FA
MHRFDLDRIGESLPVAAAREQIERAALTGAAVITAPPGTGKTTLVPPLVANLLLEGAGTEAGGGSAAPRVLVTQPRRVAVRAAAGRIAELDRSSVGGPVGFTVRGERHVSGATRIEVLTPGVLIRRLLRDPELSGVGAVILDEVHERSVEGDLLLGILAEVRALREDLIVIAMSATVQAERFAELLGGGAGGTAVVGASGVAAPVVAVPSALHPLTIEYTPAAGPRLDDRGVSRAYLAHVADTALASQRRAGCDALVFVPGAREVDETVRLLRASIDRGSPAQGSVEVLPLHGRLPAREQDRAVRGRAPGDAPRIVVSTALAESSLTVPGVHLVIDAGLSREVRRDQARSMSGLVTVSTSRASAEQRAGRAARLGAGRAIRLYSEADFARMPAHAPPEIGAADLTDAALLLAAWGTPRGAGLALPTPPPRAAIEEAESVLRALELVDSTGRITRAGARIAQLPVGPREARALLAGAAEFGDARAGAEIVAAASGEHREAGGDLTVLLRELRNGRAPGSDRWRREVERLRRVAREEGVEAATGGSAAAKGSGTPGIGRARGSASAGVILALARPEWIARRTSGRAYLLASGTRAALPEGSQLLGSEWIAIREVQRAEGRVADGTGAVIRLAAPLAEGDALRIGETLITETREAQLVDGRVRVREERRLGAILLASTPVAARSDDTRKAIASSVRERGLDALQWNDRAIALRRRLGLLHGVLGTPWPAVDDVTLLATLDDWLGADLERLGPKAHFGGLDIASALRRLLPWPEAARLDELAPERLAVPSGGTAQIVYPEVGAADPPLVAVKLQEVFGLAQSPRLVDGRVSVLFHLLSPARKPLAVTADLESFWNGPYQQVRKEMRGRYPKHPWPEDPWTAPATPHTKRAGA